MKNQKSKGGRGDLARSTSSKSTDDGVKFVVKTLINTLILPSDNLMWAKGLSEEQQILYGLKNSTGFYPDGGIILVKSISPSPIAGFIEAKKQGRGGNAIERIYRYAYTIDCLNRRIGSQLKCQGLIFACGEGTIPNKENIYGSVQRYLSALTETEFFNSLKGPAHHVFFAGQLFSHSDYFPLDFLKGKISTYIEQMRKKYNDPNS